MFGFDVEKLLVIAVVALVVIGPRDLPDTLRKLGKTIAGLRRMATQYRAQFDDMIRETEFDEVRKEFQAARNDLRETASSLIRHAESATGQTQAAERPVATSPATDISKPSAQT